MDPAFAAYGYGIIGLGSASSVGGGDSASSMTNNDSGIGNESTTSTHLFQGPHHHSQATQNIQHDLGQQQAGNPTIGGIHHHISSGIHHNHSQGLSHQQSEHNNGNNNNNGGTSTSVQIPQGK